MAKPSGAGPPPEIGQGVWPPVIKEPPPPPNLLETPEEVIRKATVSREETKVVDPRVLEFEKLPDEEIVKLYNEAGLPERKSYDRTEWIQALVDGGIRVLD
jgi:hypothetical protein